MTQSPRGVLVLDFFGLRETEVRERFPEVYHYLLERLKPFRDQNKHDTYRLNWWIHAESRRLFRNAVKDLPGFIVTSEVSKHRIFVILDSATLPVGR